MIDIGGPTMVRAAAKNFARRRGRGRPGGLRRGARRRSAQRRRRRRARALRRAPGREGVRAHGRLRRRDRRLAAASAPDRGAAGAEPRRSPAERWTLQLVREFETALRRESAPAVGGLPPDGGAGGVLGGMRQLQGKELSWNNLLDADAARKLVALFDEPAVVIVKHNNPCGVGRGADLVEAYARALASDPVSAFGSIVALNRPPIAPSPRPWPTSSSRCWSLPSSTPARSRGSAAKKNLRVLELSALRSPRRASSSCARIDGGFLAQAPDAFADDPATWTCPTRRQPTPEERRALDFAWAVTRYVKSNAIVLANGDQTVGIGAGQMSRVDSCRLAIEKAQLPGRRRGRRLGRLLPLPRRPRRPRRRPASPRSSSPAAASATTRSSPRPTSGTWPCWSPARGTSGIESRSPAVLPSPSSRPDRRDAAPRLPVAPRRQPDHETAIDPLSRALTAAAASAVAAPAPAAGLAGPSLERRQSLVEAGPRGRLHPGYIPAGFTTGERRPAARPRAARLPALGLLRPLSQELPALRRAASTPGTRRATRRAGCTASRPRRGPGLDLLLLAGRRPEDSATTPPAAGDRRRVAIDRSPRRRVADAKEKRLAELADATLDRSTSATQRRRDRCIVLPRPRRANLTRFDDPRLAGLSPAPGTRFSPPAAIRWKTRTGRRCSPIRTL